MAAEQLFEPRSIVFERDRMRRRFVTFSSDKRATREQVTKREWDWLDRYLAANPGNELNVWASFQAIRQGTAKVQMLPDGRMALTLTGSIAL